MDWAMRVTGLNMRYERIALLGDTAHFLICKFCTINWKIIGLTGREKSIYI